jgi:hypothetical protein
MCEPRVALTAPPEGFQAQIVGRKDHPILQGLSVEWPALLGANEVSAKQDFGPSFWQRFPTKRAAARCLRWLRSPRDGRLHAHRTPVRIGFQPSLSTGPATQSSGAMSLLGRPN